MDIKQLRYFVTVAEELSFSKAATKLHMSQPPLSQQIKALEEEMGVSLFFRNRREVRLTDAGKVFLRESRSLLDQFRIAVNAAIQAKEANVGTVRIGVVTSALFRVMPTFLTLIRNEFPSIDVRVSDLQSDEQVLAVGQGSLDIGIVHVRPERVNLARRQILSEPLSAVLPEGHPLARTPLLRMGDLADEPMVALSRPHAPTVFDAIIAACTRAGFSPNIKHSARSPFTIFQMVKMGFGIALVPHSYRLGGYPGVVLRDLDGVDDASVRIELIWNERQASELTRKVIEALAPRLTEILADDDLPPDDPSLLKPP
ncbi:LysR substrate-binding domain-containing protein [Variovorax sp. YR216]|uniref:LysR substrate-binding domain-containing protein n=1 Tax=Variovorax sp. YR216 TaxID=1882828 RepID=UPI000895770D|nr:LysR substrate-binding domain-containing protein [Variovorax sp. YR216]SEB07959.1 transcriptional regulator, LysR family [Variovorax sp. YR216]